MVKLICEAGINHNGSVEEAKNLIDLAVEVSAWGIKFQKRTLDIVYTQEFLDSPRESHWGKTQRDQKNGLELGQIGYEEIDSYCKEKEIYWSASCWDLESQKFLQQYNVHFNKIAGAMNGHKELLEMVAEEGKLTFVSTGMCNENDIDNINYVFRNNNNMILTHCVSAYPTTDYDCHLHQIEQYHMRGYSNHSTDILPCLVAASLGVDFIEVHITTDKTLYGSDQAMSFDKEDLLELQKGLNRIDEMFMGANRKLSYVCEDEAKKKLRYYV